MILKHILTRFVGLSCHLLWNHLQILSSMIDMNMPRFEHGRVEGLSCHLIPNNLQISSSIIDMNMSKFEEDHVEDPK